jgi:hypothetical protein
LTVSCRGRFDTDRQPSGNLREIVMAFTGVAVVQNVTNRAVRITGLSLAGDASGTVGFADKTVAPEVSIGLLPDWQPVEYDGLVSLQDKVMVTMNVVTDVTAAVPISVVKTGTTHLDFLITFHNDSAATVSAAIEIYIEFLS